MDRAYKRWIWIASLVFAVLMLTALVIYKLPVRLETLLPHEFTQASKIVEIHVHETLSSPYFDYEYVLTNPQDIEAVMEHLNDITVSRRIFTPDERTIKSPEQYNIALFRNDGSHMVLILDDVLICTGKRYVGKQYTVVKPKSYNELHEVIAGSPAWWDE